MGKIVLSLTLTLMMVVVAFPAFVVNVQAAEDWRQAYAEFFQNGKPIREIMHENEMSLSDIYFALYDFDRNGIPEIVITYWTSLRIGDPLHVYAFVNNNLVELGVSVGTSLYSSTNTSFTGLFIDADKRYPYFHSYVEIINGKLQETEIAEISENEENGVRGIDSIEIISPGHIADEWQKLRNDPGSSLEIDFHSITSANIAAHLYGSTSPTANPHPFATALREFLNDATGETGAYLINMPGAGEVVYACKDIPLDEVWITALFWLNNGNLETVIGDSSIFHYEVTESKHLKSVDTESVTYYVFENGQFKSVISLVGNERADNLIRQYNIVTNMENTIAYWNTRFPDDTEKILAMTADTPVTSTAPVTVTPATPTQNNAITVTIGNTPVHFTGQPPANIDGRILVPVRGVFESLGFDVSWNEQLRQVTLSRANDTIVIVIGSATFTTNGAMHTLDVPAQLINSSTMLPLRAALESVGYSLGWNENTRTVLITSNLN